MNLEIKVFSEDSTYGIGNGRISIMAIYDAAERQRLSNFHSACEMHYARGWDIRPRTREAYDRCRVIVEAMGAAMDIRWRAPRRKVAVLAQST